MHEPLPPGGELNFTGGGETNIFVAIASALHKIRSCTTSSPVITIPRSADSSMQTHIPVLARIKPAITCSPTVATIPYLAKMRAVNFGML